MIVSKRLLAGVMTAMMITGMCAADVSAAEKKLYQIIRHMLQIWISRHIQVMIWELLTQKRQLPSRYGRLMRRLFV